LSRIASVFARANHTAFIPYITVGYPSVETTLKVVPLLASSGCDIIELGIPFSDPLADGATIQRASYEALRQGVTPKVCLGVAQELRRQVEIPLVFMTYYNPVLKFGLEQFCSKCAEVGIDGLIIPLVTSSSSGFVYLVSLTGVTGARDKLPEELESFVAKVREKTEKPLCVGFGVSTPEQARRIANIADGVIVGSRIIQLIKEDNSLKDLCSFVKGLRDALL